MTFNIFCKTGEIQRPTSDGDREWDGDTGYTVPYDVPDSAVRAELAHLLVNDALYADVPTDERRRIESVVDRIIVNADLFDGLCENYSAELNEWAQDKFNG